MGREITELAVGIGRPARANQAVRVLHQQNDPYCVALPADHALAGRVAAADHIGAAPATT